MKRIHQAALPAVGSVLALGLAVILSPLSVNAAESFDGLNLNLGNLYRTSKAQSRSVSPENFTGEKGKAGMSTDGPAKGAAAELGQGWKVSPFVVVKGGTTFTLAEIKGPGCIQQIWMTPTGNWRHSILRFYWDDEAEPSIECPVGDFFACGWGKYSPISSLPVCVNPGSAFNCYWQMPFHKKARVTLQNIDDKQMVIYYQINYALTDIPRDAAYFHAQFRRESPLKSKGIYTILDGVKGEGQYVGTYLAWEAHSPGWWGEGEIKFFLDGDTQFPTICGTGTEDYFCGSYDFETKGADGKNHYTMFSTPYSGLAQVLPAEKLYEVGQRFGLFRWHIPDPVRFEKELKVTIQALGWKKTPEGARRYLPLEDDIASVAFWYQKEPHQTFPKLPDRAGLDFAKLSDN
jgi:hypothetical protein